MSTKTAAEYSTARTNEHIHNFFKLADMLENNYFDEKFFSSVSEKNSIFDFLDFRVYSANF
jgi:1,4-alpha-glucan branching enzyme